MTEDRGHESPAAVADRPFVPLCPRCGYDQSGLLNPAADSWPIESQCTECGCSIHWGEYARREATQPRWWLEHAPWRRFLLAIPLTALAAVFARVLWSRLRMEHPIRWFRWAVALVLCTVPLLLVVFAGVALSAKNTVDRLTQGLVPPSKASLMVVEQNGSPTVDVKLFAFEPITEFERWRAIVPVFTSPTKRSPLRIYGYITMPTAEWRREAQDAIDRLEMPSTPKLVRQRMPAVSVNFGPADIWRSSGFGVHDGVPFAGLVAILSVVSFAVLPIARRRAKVRVAHLLRTFGYLLIGPGIAISVGAWFLDLLLPNIPGRRSDVVTGHGQDLIVLVPLFLYLVFWWRLTVTEYLRMTRPTAVALSVSAISVLGASAVFLL